MTLAALPIPIFELSCLVLSVIWLNVWLASNGVYSRDDDE